jgi:hypothetical protein
MEVYTVRKSEGFNTDREFQAYVDLLEEIGIDISSVPRTHEKGTNNYWLYVWRSRTQAERFARELGDRLHDPSFVVHGPFEIPNEDRGPLAPLTIRAIPTRHGTIFRLEARSLGRVMLHFPNATLKGEVTLPREVHRPTRVDEGDQRTQAPAWDEIIATLTGLPEDAIAELGGIRILTEDGRVLHQQLPPDAPR